MVDSHAEDYIASPQHVVRQRALSLDSATRFPDSSRLCLGQMVSSSDNDQTCSTDQVAPGSPRSDSSQFDPTGTQTPDFCFTPRAIRQLPVENLLRSPEPFLQYNPETQTPAVMELPPVCTTPAPVCTTPAPVERNLSLNFEQAADVLHISRPPSSLSFSDRASSPASVQSCELVPVGLVCVVPFPSFSPPGYYLHPGSPSSMSSENYCGSEFSGNRPPSVHPNVNSHSPSILDSPAQVTPPPREPPFPLQTPEYFHAPREAFCWTVNARVLASTDKQAVSQVFVLRDTSGKSLGKYRLCLKPKVAYCKKGGGSFKKAKGRGFIQLKAMDKPEEPACLEFLLRVDSRSEELCTKRPSGPHVHDFSKKDMWELKDPVWDFDACVDKGAQKFIVSLQLLFPDCPNAQA